jgi:hypothetical protein
VPHYRFFRHPAILTLILVAPFVLLSGCLETTGREALPKITSGNYHISRVQVAKHPSIKSDKLVTRVAKEIGKKAQAHLKGKSPVILQVLIKKWKLPGNRLGGSMAETLWGTTSELSGIIRIYGAFEQTLIHEQEIVTEFSEKGFFSDKAPSEPDEIRRLMIERFTTMIVGTVK